MVHFGFDTNTTVTQAVCDAAKNKLHSFAVRYYASDASNSKVIKKSEAELILSNNLKLVVVFQDTNREAKQFSAALGKSAAIAAANCANAIGQPAGTAIYFAVDFDCGPIAYENNILPHFKAIKDYFTAQNLQYSVGVYGSGSICSKLKAALNLSYTWLSGSTGWDGSSTYTDYSIKQTSMEQSLGGIIVDFDSSSSAMEYGGITYLL